MIEYLSRTTTVIWVASNTSKHHPVLRLHCNQARRRSATARFSKYSTKIQLKIQASPCQIMLPLCASHPETNDLKDTPNQIALSLAHPNQKQPETVYAEPGHIVLPLAHPNQKSETSRRTQIT
jgi:hypothetical protein